MDGSHGETIDFSVPQPGIYDVSIEDGKSCGAFFQVDMSACVATTFSLPLVNALPGENICLEMTVDNFTDLISVQYTLTFDTDVLTFTNVTNLKHQCALL